jgi:hypothetical protein
MPYSNTVSALLSQALVAFTIEFDNEFERRTPHHITHRRRPWLASMVMWREFMRHVPEQGIAARELARLSGLDPRVLAHALEQVAENFVVDRDTLVQPTEAGSRAREVWRPLTAEIEGRWQARFSKEEIERLKGALCRP